MLRALGDQLVDLVERGEAGIAGSIDRLELLGDAGDRFGGRSRTRRARLPA